jgi:hypothetical protein
MAKFRVRSYAKYFGQCKVDCCPQRRGPDEVPLDGDRGEVTPVDACDMNDGPLALPIVDGHPGIALIRHAKFQMPMDLGVACLADAFQFLAFDLVQF